MLVIVHCYRRFKLVFLNNHFFRDTDHETGTKRFYKNYNNSAAK